MHTPDDALRALAVRMKCDPAAPERFRETLERSLVPMIRCAIRSGTGLPPLVQWVRRHLPAQAAGAPSRPADLEWAAPSMARLLCDRLLEYVRPPAQAARETVLGC
jgi:hypothetical protein